MKLYLLRHGIAVERGEPGYEADSERPLTPEGEEKMWSATQGMLRQGLSFDLILTSSYLRAKKTAEIVAKVLMAGKKLKISANLAPDADPRKLIAELSQNYSSMENVLLVGHEPFLSNLASALLTGDEGFSMTLKKGGMCKLAVNLLRYGKCATLEWLLTSRQLGKL